MPGINRKKLAVIDGKKSYNTPEFFDRVWKETLKDDNPAFSYLPQTLRRQIINLIFSNGIKLTKSWNYCGSNQITGW